MRTYTKPKDAVADLGKAIVTVFYNCPSWVMPDGTIKGWKVIIERQGVLMWAMCYHKELLRQGIHQVELTRNSRYELTIKPQ